jgi:tRNA-2-methylthio-N6-dimethylallyladenosine synthase
MSTSPVFKLEDELVDALPAFDLDPSVPRSRRVYLEVFGCQMNKLDAELMVGALLEHGYRVTDQIDDAGAALYVTCSVRQHAEDRVLSKIGGLKRRKRREPDFVVGVLGCMAQRDAETLRRRHPYIGLICGTGEFLKLPQLLEEARRSRTPVVATDLEADVKFERRRNLGPNRAQAFVSVMRGCDQACTFCIVPATRGKEISRPVREIDDEVRALVDDGVKEVTLLGQTVNSYGKRLAPGRSIGLHHLLHQLNKISGLKRIRFITSHPRFMTPDLIDAMADLEKVCEYLHLPIQSGSDVVLRRMLRTYTIDRYRSTIEHCRRRIRGFALATDFIVGFPGESDEDFEASCGILEEMRFQGSFVFKYSPRPGTRAHDLVDDVPEPVKQERNQRLLRLQEAMSLELYRRRIGSIEEVLVEGPSKNDPTRLTGRNRAHQIVVFPAGAGRESLAGELVAVRIVDATALTLYGELVSGAGAPPAAPRAGALVASESIRLFDPVGG